MLDSSNWKLATITATSIAAGTFAGLLWTKNRNGNKEIVNTEKWIKVGEISKLMIYPIKSCQGVSVDEGEVTMIGLKGSSDILRDRTFMVVDSRNVFQTQRTVPKMSLIGVDVSDDMLTLRAADGSNYPLPVSIRIPEDIPQNRKKCKIFEDFAFALDCGEIVGIWLDEYLGKTGFKLFYNPVLDKTQRKMTALQHKFPRFVSSDKASFHDQTSYMLMAEESIDELNKILPEGSKKSDKNFRPTILIKGIPQSFAEDFFSFVKIGENGPLFKASRPCIRCKLTTVIPETGDFDPNNEPLRSLRKLKRNYGDEATNKIVKNEPVLGLHLGFLKAGDKIKVGDPVYAPLL